jgi:hypothetical protein
MAQFIDFLNSGILHLVIGIFLVLKLYGTKPKNPNSLLHKYPTGMKLGAFALVIHGTYTLIAGFLNLGENSNSNWTAADQEIMVQQCIKASKTTHDEYPELVDEYCNCAIKEITTKFNKKDYLEIAKQGPEALQKYEYPAIRYCYYRLTKAIEQEKQK